MVGKFLMAEESVCKITAMQVKHWLRVKTGVKMVPSQCPPLKLASQMDNLSASTFVFFPPNTLEFLCALAWVCRKHS